MEDDLFRVLSLLVAAQRLSFGSIQWGKLTCYSRSYSFAYIQYDPGTKTMSSGSTQGNDN